MPPEQTFYADQSGVFVTSARFVVGGMMYPLQGITAATVVVLRPARVGPILSMALGILAVVAGIATKTLAVAILGSIAAVGGIVWIALQKSTFALQIWTGGGQSSALVNRDQAYIWRVAQALTWAITNRP